MKKMLFVAAVALAFTACKSEIDNKPAAVVADAPIEAPAVKEEPKEAAPAAQATTLTLNAADSAVEWVGAKVTGDHKGGFKTISGTAQLNEKNELSALKIEVDTTSVFSDAEKLTGHLASPDFFDVANHPKASFELTGAEPAAAEGVTHTITGNMTIRGVTKTISFPAKVEIAEGQVTASSEFTLKRFDFGIAYAGKADDLIKDDVLMKLNLKFAK